MSFIKNPAHPDLPVCGNLRAKASYIPDFNDEHFMKTYYRFGQYVCLETLHQVGPDDRPVCPSDCIPERSCFESLISGSLPLAGSADPKNG